MGLYLKQENNRSRLQERIAADLAEKAKKQPQLDGAQPDGIDDSAYMEDKKLTTSLAWMWVVIGVAVIALLIWLAVSSM